MDRPPGREGCNRKPGRRASASVRAHKGRAWALARLRRRPRTDTGARLRRRRGIRPMSRPRAGSGGRRGLEFQPGAPDLLSASPVMRKTLRARGAHVRKVAPPATKFAPIGVVRSTNWNSTVICARLLRGASSRLVEISDVRRSQVKIEIRDASAFPSPPLPAGPGPGGQALSEQRSLFREQRSSPNP